MNVICHDIRHTYLSKDEVTKLMVVLIQLGGVQQGRDVFLETRSKLIKKTIRSIRYEGKGRYVQAVSTGVFTIVQNTIKDFLEIFNTTAIYSSM